MKCNRNMEDLETRMQRLFKGDEDCEVEVFYTNRRM